MMFAGRLSRKALMNIGGIAGAGLLMVTMADQAMSLEPDEEDYELKLLGKYVFFDKISNPPRMACVTCHDPTTGGTGSVAGVNLHQVAITGANPHTVGNLKPPTNAYASFIAPLHNRAEGCFDGTPSLCGGNFWNGRAEGEYPPLFPAATKHIGIEVFQNVPAGHRAWQYDKYFGPTSDQALNPMPNPVEQNVERQAVCKHVASAKYGELYFKAWGVAIDCRNISVGEINSAPDAANLPEKEYDISFKRIMLAVGAWQHSKDLNSFTSKRDMALRAELACEDGSSDADPKVCNHPNYINSPGEFPLVGLTDQENLGHDLFYNTIRGPKRPDLPVANCAFCHSDKTGADGGEPDNGAEPLQLYADDGYHNIGTPRNPEIPEAFDANGNPIDPDRGLMGLTGNPQHGGFFKTPTTRNVDKRKGGGFTKAYTHNGWFKSLESLVRFYNTADVNGATAATFGITRCPEGIETEKAALANNCWPAPAVSGNGPGSPAFPFLLGDLGMSREQEAALVAYMKTLTDQHTAVKPRPYQSSKR